MCSERSTGLAEPTTTGLVHDALRRDLRRFADALTDVAPRDTCRAAALAEHWSLLAEIFRRQVRVRSALLWPLVRRRAPHIGLLVDRLEDDLVGTDTLLAHAACRLEVLARSPGDEAARAAARRAVITAAEVLRSILDAEERVVLVRAGELLDRGEWLWVEAAQQRALGPRRAATVVPWLIGGGHRARLLWGTDD